MRVVDIEYNDETLAEAGIAAGIIRDLHSAGDLSAEVLVAFAIEVRRGAGIGEAMTIALGEWDL